MTTCGVDWFSRESGDRSFIIFIFSVNFVIPLFIASFCYYFVYSTVGVNEIEVIRKKNSEKKVATTF